MSARDELTFYAASTRTVTADGLAPYLDAVTAEVRADSIPAWEAVYEPGNVSDYLIGYTNDEQPARSAAEAWFRSQCETPHRIEWRPQPELATGDYDAWHDLAQVTDDGMVLATGITVRHRVQQPAPVGEARVRAAAIRDLADELWERTLLLDDCECVTELRRMADEIERGEQQ